MLGLFEWKCVCQCLPGHPLQNFLEIDQPEMNHPFLNGTKDWFIIPGTWWICVHPGWRNLLLCLRDLRVDFVPLSSNATKNPQLFLNVNIFVFCPILCQNIIGVVIIKLLDRSGLPDTTVDNKKALEARKLLSASDLHGNRRHSERTTQITAIDYEKALEARKLFSAIDLHGNRCHSERTTQMLTQQCRQQALLAMSA